jgi:hypothetical protein
MTSLCHFSLQQIPLKPAQLRIGSEIAFCYASPIEVAAVPFGRSPLRRRTRMSGPTGMESSQRLQP